MTDHELASACEFVRDRLYYTSLRTRPRDTSTKHFFCVDDDLVYEPFFADFGPLNMGQLYRFCQALRAKLDDAALKRKTIYFYSSFDQHKRANAGFLIGAFAVLYLNRSAEEAYEPFVGIYPPFLHFRDAAYGVSTFNLTLLDVLRGIQRGKEFGWIDFAKFNLEEYEHYERVENGDLNWIIPKKFLAFSGPSSRRQQISGILTWSPDEYVPLFKRWNVNHVIRLNKKLYDKVQFTKHGIQHTDLYFIDGGTPSQVIIKKFLEVCETEPSALAVHCKAGLGRTGTLIGCYVMKHFRITANEFIGYIRVCRPGSVIGPQQQFLKELEQKLWKAGDEYRQQLTGRPSAGLSTGTSLSSSVHTPSRPSVDSIDSPQKRTTSRSDEDELSSSLNRISLSGTSSSSASPAYNTRSRTTATESTSSSTRRAPTYASVYYRS